MKNLNFIDLCAGIGGFRIAFEKAGATCVMSCEIDKYARQTYLENFVEHNFELDITKINEETMVDFDILCAGFPCQAFSLAGKQMGFADTRGTIFFDVARILKEKQPKAFLLENVKNLKSHDCGNTFKVICNTINELDYWYDTFIINAKYFVPQNRERLYFVGLNKKEYTEAQFLKLVEMIKMDYSVKQNEKEKNFWKILDKEVDMSYTLSDKLWNCLKNHAIKHEKKGNGFGFGLMTKKDKISRTLTARYNKDGSEILIEQEYKNPRKLTPKECSRLMGFPDEFKIVVSKTQSYKQFGNSVVIPVISLFANNIIKCL